MVVGLLHPGEAHNKSMWGLVFPTSTNGICFSCSQAISKD